MNKKQLRERMRTYDQQDPAQQKATVEAVVAALGQNLDSLRQVAESIRPLYEVAKAMPEAQFKEQLRVWCAGDQEKIEATLEMIQLIDDWRLLK